MAEIVESDENPPRQKMAHQKLGNLGYDHEHLSSAASTPVCATQCLSFSVIFLLPKYIDTEQGRADYYSQVTNLGEQCWLGTKDWTKF